MTVFYIYIVKNNGQAWEVRQGGDVDLSNAYRCVETFIGFADKLVDDPVFEQVHGNNQRQNESYKREDEVKKDATKPFQD